MKSVSFRTPTEKLSEIDKLAEAQHRDRSFILNEALDQYLDLQNYHRSLIEQGLREADAGMMVPFDEVKRHIAEARAARESRARH